MVVENLPAELWERPSSELYLDGFAHRTHMHPPLLVSVFPVPHHHVKLTYDTALFSRDEAQRLIDGYVELLASVEGHQGAPTALSSKLDPALERAR